jgi:hypothetical protein
LCLAGLDLSITNRDGLTAEQLACNLKHANIANLLGSLRRVSFYFNLNILANHLPVAFYL